jgi:glycogen synthase
MISMRVFMLGWEFPPFISGGLGTACYGLTKALNQLGTDVVFVLPRPVSMPFSTHVRLVSPSPVQTKVSRMVDGPVEQTEIHLDEFEHVTFRTIESTNYNPYNTPAEYTRQLIEEKQRYYREILKTRPAEPVEVDIQEAGEEPRKTEQPAVVHTKADNYGGDLFAEIHRYAGMAGQIATTETFDVVHAHDWMTYPAGLAASAASGKPLIVHVHSTEFDRAGSNIDTRIYDIERMGMHAAQRIIAVSVWTKNICVHHYGIDPAKIDVVYNAVENNGSAVEVDEEKASIKKDEKIVLFLGRITMQKGPEYFLAAAKKVLEVMQNVKFVMAGSGDMVRRTIELAQSMGIGDKVIFTGFLRGKDVEQVYKMADLYVMPSVSEPFGIAPLEAMSHDVPVIISKQSGVSEVLQHALKVDFWDIPEMANKIVAVLRHPPLAHTLRQHGAFEVRQMSWLDAAGQCNEVYSDLVPTKA